MALSPPVNCQARSCAPFVSLMSKGLLDRAVESPQAFLAMLAKDSVRSFRTTLRVFGEGSADRSKASSANRWPQLLIDFTYSILSTVERASATWFGGS